MRGMEERRRSVGHGSCDSAGGGKDGEVCADLGGICKGARGCDELLLIRVYWSSYKLWRLTGWMGCGMRRGL